jgi:Family of unknown function (DUF6175)
VNKYFKYLVAAATLLAGFCCTAQNFQPRIMVIPFTKDGEDIRTVLDNDANRRIAITKVEQALDAKGYNTVSFIGKLNSARDNHLFTSDNQTDIKSQIIEMSGCDIYVIVEVDAQSDNDGSAVSVTLSAYDVSTANSLSSAVGNSGKFFTNDLGHLTSKAVDKGMDDFVPGMEARFAVIEKNGNSVLLDISFADGSSNNMDAEIGDPKTALSDRLENWVSKNAMNGNYHIQGKTSLKMIFDEVKIPLRDMNNNIYSSNKFSSDFSKYLKTLGLSSVQQVKGGVIYVTIN